MHTPLPIWRCVSRQVGAAKGTVLIWNLCLDLLLLYHVCAGWWGEGGAFGLDFDRMVACCIVCAGL